MECFSVYILFHSKLLSRSQLGRERSDYLTSTAFCLSRHSSAPQKAYLADSSLAAFFRHSISHIKEYYYSNTTTRNTANTSTHTVASSDQPIWSPHPHHGLPPHRHPINNHHLPLRLPTSINPPLHPLPQSPTLSLLLLQAPTPVLQTSPHDRDTAPANIGVRNAASATERGSAGDEYSGE